MSMAVIGVSALVAVAGTAIQAYGQYQAGKAAEAEGEMAQQLAEQKAKLLERQGEAEVARGKEEALRRQEIGAELEAEQTVGYAKGGVLGVTPEIVIKKTGEDTLTDRMTMLRNAYLNQSFANSQAANARFEGEIYKYKGESAARAGMFGAVGTILTGVSSLSGGAKGGQLNDMQLAKKHGIAYT